MNQTPDTCVEKGCTAPAGKYTRGRCESCYRKKIRMGIFTRRDVTVARDHIEALRRLGWTYEGIAEAAGLSSYVPHKVSTGQTKSLRVESEQALLAVPLVPFDSHRSVDSAGTRRRVQALAWMGWPCAEVARRAGTTQPTLATLILPRRRISFALARRVAAVYDELCMTFGPSKIAAGKARQLGFVPPLGWDEDLIDLPKKELEAELARRVAEMDEAELRRCYTARYAHRDVSPLVAAAAREYGRSRDRRAEAAA